MAEEHAQAQDKQIAVNAQYIKDLSFENPLAPASLVSQKDKPQIDISVDVKAAVVGEDMYEVVLGLSAKAIDKTDEEERTLFICELQYGGVFTIKGVSEEEREPALLIFCPSLLFPYARRLVSDTTRDGGFPPLMLDPIDFARLYAQRKQQQAEQAPVEGSA